MILITRPFEEAQILAKEFTKLNLNTVMDPLISFKSTYRKIKFKENSFYLVSSLQAVKSLLKYQNQYSEILNEGRFLVIGKKVRNELKKNNNIRIKKITENSDEMYDYLIKNKLLFKNKFNLIYLSGSIINNDFLRALKHKKISVKRVIIYKVIPTKKLKRKTVSLLKQNKIKQIVLFSSYTAQTLIKLLSSEKLKKKVSKIQVFSLSGRIDKYVKKSRFFEKTFVSAKPNQQSLIKVLTLKKQ